MADATDDDEEVGTPAASAPTSGAISPAAPAAAPAPSGPDFTSMIKPPGDMAALQGQLSAIQKAKAATNAANADETTKRLDVDRARMEQAYKASATMPDELKQGWDSKAKSAEHSTDPVTAFGSLGSVFAMLASSFAGLPMEAGLNAGAAAINAIHAGDEKAYNREYESWKANTDLALKRQQLQHQAYTDATNLMNSNINAGRTKMELAATKFGDQKAQALLDAGMDKELFTLFADRNKASLELQNQWDKVQLEHTKVMDLKADPRFQDRATKGQAITDWTQRWSGAAKAKYDTVQQLQRAWDNEHPQAGFDERKNAFVDIEKSVAEAQDTGTPGASGPLSTGKMKTKAIQEIIDNDAAQGITTSIADATKRYNLQTSTPSGNRIDDINKQINMFDNGKNAIDRALAAVDKHWGTAGVAGYATRGGERVGNIFGSNETDRVQFAHDIQYLQTIAPRLLNDASSRGLKAEADKVSAIIAGLNVGDTTANTKRALGEVRELWDKMQQDNVARRNGTPNGPGGQPAGSTSTGSTGDSSGSKKAPWQNDPIVKPRAEADSDVAYG